MADVRLNKAATRRFIHGVTKDFIDEVTRDVESDARRRVRVRSGRTRGQTYRVPAFASGGTIRGIVRCDSSIATIEDGGHRPHSIGQRPGGPLLTFFWEKKGHWVSLKHVNHPGAKGSRFLTGSLVDAATQRGLPFKINAF